MTSSLSASPNQITSGRRRPLHCTHLGNSSNGILASLAAGSGDLQTIKQNMIITNGILYVRKMNNFIGYVVTLVSMSLNTEFNHNNLINNYTDENIHTLHIHAMKGICSSRTSEKKT